MSRPGFKVVRIEVEDDSIIEIESIASESSDLDELLAMFDELGVELNRVRNANKEFREKIDELRGELTRARVEINNLKYAAFLDPRDGRKFISDGWGAEIEVTTYNDLQTPDDRKD